MEGTIPPRDHGASTFKYTWDENGEVTQIDRLPSQSHFQHPAMAQHTRQPSRQARQTVQWPFSRRGKSIATIETAISSQLLDNSSFGPMPLPTKTLRPVTWEPKRMLPPLRRDSSWDVDTDLVPDYVINYIRGETPETVARRKNNDGKIGERGVDVVKQHRPQQSRVAEFEGVYDDASSTTRHENSFERLHGWDDEAEDSHILSREGTGTRGQEKGCRRLAVGWRGGVATNLLLTCLILLVGIVCLILAVSKGSSSAGEAVIYTGLCSTTDRVNLGLHILVSVFGIIMLAGTNYAFQVLSSPTRREADTAHRQRKWLHVGEPSLRNFAYIGKSRVALFAGLLLLALATQTIYNAVVFTSRTATDTKLLMVTQWFPTGAVFSSDTTNNEAKLSQADIESLQKLAIQQSLTNITSAECVARVNKDGAFNLFQQGYEDILMVVSQGQSEPNANSVLHTGDYATQIPPQEQLDHIEYCLVKEATALASCRVHLHTSLLGVTILLNFAMAAMLAFVLFKPNFDPLVSLGDAISSFLQKPDMTTARACLLSKADVTKKLVGITQAKYYVPRRYFWFQSPTVTGWVTFLLSWATITALAATALHATVVSEEGHLSPLGSTASEAQIMTMSPLQAAILACLPQLLLVSLYFTTNSLMTTYYLSHEASSFALGTHRPLRVTTSPQGSQINSLYLTLPRPWSWFLITLFIAMSFFLSQAIFPMSVSLPVPMDGESHPTAIGVSGTGLVVLISLLAALLFVVVGLGFRQANPILLATGQAEGNPLTLKGGSCSAVFSAWCHPGNGERDVWKKEVAWGVVHGERGPGSHCGFTAGKVGKMDLARSYA